MGKGPPWIREGKEIKLPVRDNLIPAINPRKI